MPPTPKPKHRSHAVPYASSSRTSKVGQPSSHPNKPHKNPSPSTQPTALIFSDAVDAASTVTDGEPPKPTATRQVKDKSLRKRKKRLRRSQSRDGNSSTFDAASNSPATIVSETRPANPAANLLQGKAKYMNMTASSSPAKSVLVPSKTSAKKGNPSPTHGAASGVKPVTKVLVKKDDHRVQLLQRQMAHAQAEMETKEEEYRKKVAQLDEEIKKLKGELEEKITVSQLPSSLGC